MNATGGDDILGEAACSEEREEDETEEGREEEIAMREKVLNSITMRTQASVDSDRA